MGAGDTSRSGTLALSVPDRHHILAIETSNPSAWTPEHAIRPGVAVGRLRGHQIDILARYDIDPSRPHDDTLLMAIDTALNASGGSPRSIKTIAVSAGPGGFTAVRLAIVAAKMIAEVTGAACIAVPSAAVAAARVRPGPRPFAVLLASKGDSSYATLFDGGALPAGVPRIVRAADLPMLGAQRIIADHHLPDPISAAAAALRVPVERPEFDPAACLEICSHYPSVDPAALLPLYPREPEAVTKWRELHPPGKGGGGS